MLPLPGSLAAFRSPKRVEKVTVERIILEKTLYLFNKKKSYKHTPGSGYPV